MGDEDFWTTVRNKDSASQKAPASGALRLALLFGTAAIAFAIFVLPMMTGQSDSRLAYTPDFGVDMMTTGSVRRNQQKRIYTLRQSITQPMPGKPCIIDSTGHPGENC